MTDTRSSADADKLQQVLGAFYKTVDVMKGAKNSKTKLMSIWPDDMKAVEDVVAFLEDIRDSGAPTASRGAGAINSAQPAGSANLPSPSPSSWQPTDLQPRCADFKANHDMGYSADDLTAFVLTEIDRASSLASTLHATPAESK